MDFFLLRTLTSLINSSAFLRYFSYIDFVSSKALAFSIRISLSALFELKFAILDLDSVILFLWFT